jgi:hypothetical protein
MEGWVDPSWSGCSGEEKKFLPFHCQELNPSHPATWAPENNFRREENSTTITNNAHQC